MDERKAVKKTGPAGRDVHNPGTHRKGSNRPSSKPPPDERFEGPPWSRVMKNMHEAGILDMELAPWLFEERPSAPLKDDLEPRVKAMLMGMALGDALGAPTESMVPTERRRVYGFIRNLGVGTGHAIDTRRHGILTTDDSQLAFWTVEHLLEDGGYHPRELAARFCGGGRLRGSGYTTRTFLLNIACGLPWYEAGVTNMAASNGALMRIAPVLLPYLAEPSCELWAEVALAASLTHDDSASTAACLAWVAMLLELLGMDEPPKPMWWVERYVTLCRPLERGTYRPRGGQPADFSGPLWRLVEQEVTPVARGEVDLDDALGRWHSGAYLLETVPCLLAILAALSHEPEAAVLTAVNETKDNDTIASLTATAVGALHGPAAFPERWTDAFDGRLDRERRGRVQALSRKAARNFAAKTTQVGPS